MEKGKVLVTGGAGFIGSHLCEALLDEDYGVAVVDNLRTGKKENLPERAEFHQLDICSEEIGGLFAEEKFSAVCHLAAQNDVRTSVTDPQFDAQVNVLGSVNLLENCAKNNVSRFVFASTGGAIYGESEKLPVNESHPIRPESPYGITKHAVELYMHYFSKICGLQARSLRLGNVYGPRQDPYGEAGVIAIFSGAMLEGRPSQIFGDGEQLRDYIYVWDVVTAFLRALEGPAGEPLNIGTGTGTNVNEIYWRLAALLGYTESPEYAPKRPGEIQRIYLDSKRAQKELGWMPRVTFEEGLTETAAWFRANHSSAKGKPEA